VSLSADEVRDLLRECVTVVKPGETLIIRLPADSPEETVSYYRDRIQAAREHYRLPFQVVVVAADGLGVAEAEVAS
jgi:hypothetical protein